MLAAPISFRNVCWLTLGLTMVAGPHVERLPWWISLLAILLAGWRLYLARFRLRLPGKWLLLLIVAFGTAGVYLHFRTIFGRDAGVALLIVMLTCKLLETRTQRDAILLSFMGYFLVITNFLYSQTIPTAVYMLGCIWVITATMIGLQYAGQPRSYRQQLRTSGLLLAQAAPLMLILFLLFPRVQGPLWGMPTDAYSRSSGLSDTMTPGSLSNLILSDAVAFRVSFQSPVPPPEKLYWRGPVLWDFDGRTWTAPRFAYGEPRFETHTSPVEYTVTVEPHSMRWLFALDLPGKVPPAASATGDFQLLSNVPVSNRIRYEMTSYLEYRYGVDDSTRALRRSLQLPSNYNPRTLAYAQSLRRQHPSDDKAVIREVLSLFRNQGYVYTLAPPLLGTHSVDEFLFQAKSGFCEHYSSAFAVLMRSAGIPARIVTGYLGGEINTVGGYLIVRQADAHAWTEVWLEKEGWVRVDPTAAVSPARVERGIGASVSLTDELPLLMRGDYPLLRRARLAWDSAANTWNQWVLGYSVDRQRQFLSRVGLEDATWRSLTVILMAATGLATLVLAIFMLRRLRQRVRDPVKAAYLKFCGKLQRKGIARAPSEGASAYASRVAAARPDLDAAVKTFSDLYVALRYGPQRTEEGIGRLQRLVRDFRP